MNVGLLLPFLGLLLGVQSKECAAPSDIGYFNVTDQHHIDALSSSCTSILGSLRIARNFTGQFLLPNITEIIGQIRVDGVAWKRTPEVTSIDLPDLQYLEGSIDLGSLSDTLERISIPKLEHVRSMFIEQYIDHAEVDFRGLKKADYLDVRGNYSKVSFDSLQNVTETLSICNQDVCDMGFDGGARPRRAMNVSLPSLEVADDMIIAGDVSDLNVPRLQSAGLIVHSANTSVQFSFPHYTYSDKWLKLEGRIRGLSMPRLQDVAINLEISSSYPLKVTLPVTKSYGIFLDGQIEDVSLPNLQNFALLDIHSDLPLDCDAVDDRITEAQIDPNGEHTLACKSTYEKPSGRLATKAKIAIGVVVGVVGLGIIIGAILFWKKKRMTKNKVVTKNNIESEVELTTYGPGLWGEDSGQDPGTEAGVVHKSPPPYEAHRG